MHSADLAKEIDARFADRLRPVRHFRGLTMDEVAERVGMAKNSVQKCETGALRANGTRQPPRSITIGEAIAFCQALGVGLGVMCDPEPIDWSALPEWREP